MTCISDEDRLDSIAHFLFPFSPPVGSNIEIETESDNVASNLQPAEIKRCQTNIGQAVAESESAVGLDLRLNSLKTNHKSNKRKINRHFSPTENKRQVLGEEDDQLSFNNQGKMNHTVSFSESDTSLTQSQNRLSSNNNLYDSNSTGLFDVLVQRDKDSNISAPIDPLAIGRLLYPSNKNDIIEI